MRTMRFRAVVLAYFLLSGRTAFGQWTRTTFSDSVAVNAIACEGSNIFIAGGAELPVALGSGRGVVAGSSENNSPGVDSAVDPKRPSATGQFGMGVYLSTDGGSTWDPAGLRDTSIYSLAVVGDVILAGTSWLGLFRSTDDGVVWVAADSGIPVGTITCLTVVPEPGGAAEVFAGTAFDGLYISTDSGMTWTQSNNGMNGWKYVASIGGDGKNLFTSIWYGGGPLTQTDTDAFYRSTDYGENWIPMNLVQGGQPIAQAFDGICPDELAISGYWLYTSSDSGEVWTKSEFSLRFDALDIIGDNIFAGTDSGVYRSTDGGTSWISVDTGLADSRPVGMLAANSTDLFAVTGLPQGIPVAKDEFSQAVCVRPLSQLTSVIRPSPSVPEVFSLSQNYPNPFNPSTSIGYRLSAVSHMTLTVYDVLGRRVRTLVNEVERTGEYNVEFNGSGLASGVYFYRMSARPVYGEASGYSKVMKMLMLK